MHNLSSPSVESLPQLNEPKEQAKFGSNNT